jgi:mercuric ion binding protein
VTVKKSLTQLDGVKRAKVTLQPPEAVVVFDPAKVSIEDLVHATTYAGYPSSVKGEGGK